MSKMIEAFLHLFLIAFIVVTLLFALPVLVVIALINTEPEKDAVRAQEPYHPGLLRAGSWGFTAVVFGVFCTAWFQMTSVFALVAGIGVAVGLLPADPFNTL